VEKGLDFRLELRYLGSCLLGYCVAGAPCRWSPFSQRHRGATKNARPDIARLDYAAPYRKGGHRETCFSVPVDAHYEFMLDSGSII